MRAHWYLLLPSLLMLGHSSAAQAPLELAALDRFITEQMKVQRVPGLALAITHGDEVLYVKGYGTAGDAQAVTPQTQFLIASLSKSFTALAVMQLVEGGEVDLDAPVRTYLPEFTLADSSVAAQITIRQLLNQTSGLADAGFPAMRLPQPATPQERVSSLSTARSVTQSGSAFHYFNPNYEVLARVVEVVSGQSFSNYLQTHIFAPLGMAHTTNVLTSAEISQKADALAQGHLLAFGIPIASPEESGYLGGSGGVISSAEDMARYLIAQLNGGRFRGTQLLSSEGVALMQTPPQSGRSSYGMGWFVGTADGTRVLEHNGVLSTFYGEAVLLPETGYGFVLLYNIHSVAQDSLAFPRFKSGLIALLTGNAPPVGGASAGLWGVVFAFFTLLGVTLAVRSLLHLPQWTQRARATPLWRLTPGIAFAFLPLALVLAMPALVLTFSGRTFGYPTLFRSMVSVMTWLGLVGLLSAVNAVSRLVVLFATRLDLALPFEGKRCGRE